MHRFVSGSIALALVALGTSSSKAQYTPYFFDGFDVTADSSNINFEAGVPRQGGAPAPIVYETSTADPTNDYRHQVFGPGGANQPLQLAEDGFNVPGGAAPIFSFKSMVSPDFNFNGTLPNGDVIGKRITFTLDVAAFLQAKQDNPAAPTFTKAGISIGGGHTLIDDDDEIAVQNGDPVNANFAVSFIEDDFGGLGDFAQVYEDGFTVTEHRLHRVFPQPLRRRRTPERADRHR
ncbi:MAG: hypothetical protein CMJ58_07845 [Planctomycetaceae bacterium]|nr:hypothetical protein [Planctomycetaceae bacterium]